MVHRQRPGCRPRRQDALESRAPAPGSSEGGPVPRERLRHSATAEFDRGPNALPHVMRTERLPPPMAIATLIRMPSVVGRYALTLNRTPPLSVAYLAGSLTAAGHEVQVIDAIGEALGAMHPGHRPDIVINGLSIPEIVDRIRLDTDFVGISCLFSHEWPLVRRLIAAIATRFPTKPIVLGGEHATAVPELCLEDAAALCACAL